MFDRHDDEHKQHALQGQSYAQYAKNEIMTKIYWSLTTAIVDLLKCLGGLNLSL